MAGILFNYIPGSGLTAPLFTFEVNSGGQYQQKDRFVIIGHATAVGPAAIQPGVPTPVSDQNTVDQLCGPGSQLREMFRIASMNAPAAPFYLVAVADSGAAAVWTLTVAASPALGVGTLVLAGETVQVTVGPTDTPTTIAAALAAAVNGYFNPLTKAMLPVTASASAAVVTFTARHKGAIFNETDFWVQPAGTNVFAAAGVVALARTADGAGVPSLAAAMAALGDDPADYIVSPWADSQSLATYGSTTNDVSGRWAWSRQSYGHVWSCPSGTFASLTTLGLSLNERHQTLIGRITSPQAAWAVTFTGNPANNSTITLNGTTITFVTASPAGPQVQIGVSLSATLTALLTYLTGASDANLAKLTFSVVGGTVLNVFAVTPGPIGNYFVHSTTVAGATVAQTTVSNGSPHGSWLWATGFAARLSPWLSDCDTGNVSRNHTGMVIQGVLPPRDRSVWPVQYGGRNTLNNSGISTWSVAVDGSLQVEKLVTTYQLGSGGQPDVVFRDIQAVYQVAGGLKYIRAVLAAELANKAIADSNPAGLGALTTVADIKAVFAHAYTQLCANGVFENASAFIGLLSVVRDTQNRARVNAFVPLDRVSPLDILASNATVYQQLPNAA